MRYFKGIHFRVTVELIDNEFLMNFNSIFSRLHDDMEESVRFLHRENMVMELH